MNKKFKRKDILEQVGETQYIIHPAKEKKGRRVGEVTIGKAIIRLPMKNFPLCIDSSTARKVVKAVASFQDVSFVNTADQPLTIIVTAKTECRSNDVYNEEAGKRIVDSKIQSISFRVAKRVAKVFSDEYRRYSDRLVDMSEFLEYCIGKEKSYLERALYLPKDK